MSYPGRAVAPNVIDARCSELNGSSRDGAVRVRAPLPASVLGIHVTTGDRVERGHPLVTLSAMKMEIVCDSPVDGIVQSIDCAVGQLVEADQELVRLQIAIAEVEPVAPEATDTRRKS